MSSKNNLEKKIWGSKDYYQTISALEDFSHPGFQKAIELCKESQTILDVGCGDGSKLERLAGPLIKGTGTELSQMAIGLAKQKFPKSIYKLQKSSELPFTGNKFDCVTNFFVLEHTIDPMHLITEMIRVCKKNGLVILLCPNFGAPNRASPNFIGSRASKLMSGFISDLTNSQALNWNKVKPKITSIKEFIPDLDTTAEPYLGSLIKFLKSKGDIIETNSYWEMEKTRPKLIQRLFKLLGQLQLYPFKYWGPHLFLVFRKK